MTDDIVTRLRKMADRYKGGDLDILYADYETICDAWRQLEEADQKIGFLIAEWCKAKGIGIGEMIELYEEGLPHD